MKLLTRFLLSVSIIVSLSSCIKIIYIGKRIDPEIVLEKEHHDIVFVNLFDYTSAENIKEKEEISYHAGVLGLLDGLSSFSADSSFGFFLEDTLKKGIEKGFLTTLLPVDTVSAICNRNQSDMLLALDSMNISIDLETRNYYDEFGNLKRTKNFYLNTKFYVSLYSVTGDLINRSELDQSSLYISRQALTGIITMKPSLARASYEVGSLAYQSGQDYVAKFYPQITRDTRQLFSGKAFRESNQFIFSRNWKKAIELLEELTKSLDPLIAEKARHNLEVVKEASEAEDSK